MFIETDRLSTEIFLAGTRDATIARMELTLDGEVFVVDGTSKRDPQDEDNVEIAELLALGRAFESLSNKLLKRANGLVKHNDDVRKYREVQKAKRVADAKKASVKKATKTLKTLAKSKQKG